MPTAQSETSVVRWLRAVVWGAVLLPLLAFLASGWWGYERAFADAKRTVLRANAVVSQHADRAFAGAAQVLARVDKLVAGPDDDVRAHYDDLSQRLRDMALGRPGFFAISAWDERGELLVSSQPRPPGPPVSIADRGYFRAVRDTQAPLVVSPVVDGRVTGRPLFNLAVRRTDASGKFAGALLVTMDPLSFQEFYRSMASEEPGLTSFSLFLTDGSLLTRWPAPGASTRIVPPQSPVLAQARAGRREGVLFMHSSFDPERRLLSFQQLGDLPVYTTAGLAESTILTVWYRFMAVLSAILLPTAAVLVYVAVLALRKTRGEHAVALELQEQVRRRAQAERALLQSQKLEALGRVTGGVAHDFNNLLAVISNNVHLLKRVQSGGVSETALSAISRAVSNGVRLTRQLLSFARKQALKPEPIALQDWLPGTGELLRTTLGGAVTLRIEVDPDTPPVLVDTAELELALINLAVNAKDAMPDGGELRVAAGVAATAVGPPMVTLCVTDTGMGIDESVLGKVFEPFFTTKQAGKGSGLGLSQVYGFCDQAGGSVTIESEPGRGTSVCLHLPTAAAAPVPATRAATAPVPEREPLAGQVLLVEDNDELARSQVALMTSFGLRVTRAQNADVALALLSGKASGFDVVLSDISMPGTLDGIQLAFRVRATHPHLPVLLTTGYAARIHDATQAGFRVLSKPTEAGDLYEELARALASAPREARAHEAPSVTSRSKVTD